MSTALTLPTDAPLRVIQPDTQADYFALPAKARAKVSVALKALVDVETLVAAGKKLMAAVSTAAQAHGLTAKTLYNYYRTWIDNGKDWRALTPKWKPGKSAELPKEFIAFWRALWQANKRMDGLVGARRELERLWLSDTEIPGYGRASEWYAARGRVVPRSPVLDRDLPPGWSATTLRRYAPRDQYTRTIAKRGIFAAHGAEAAMVLRDRSTLRPMELIAFDDFWLDFQVFQTMQGGEVQICRPLGLAALDVATGTVLHHGLKPRVHNADGSTQAMKRDELRWLIGALFDRHGYPRDYQVTLMVENNTASLGDEDILLLQQTLGCRVVRTGLLNRALTKGGYIQEGGQPWWKGWIEAFFRVLHTSLAHLPGQVGSRYELAPAETLGAVKETLALAKRCEGDLELFDKLRKPILDFAEAEAVVAAVVQALGNRFDHALQGFSKTKLWRRSAAEQWQLMCADFLTLSPELMRAAEIIERLETPNERWDRLRAKEAWLHASPAVLAPLHCASRVAKIRNGKLVLKASDKASEPLTFWEPNSAVLSKDGEVQAYMPDDWSCAHIWRAGRYEGTVARQQRVAVLDQEATLCEAGIIHRARQEARRPAIELRANEDARRAADRTHNEAVLAAAAARGSQLEAAAARIKEKKAAASRINTSEAEEILTALKANVPAVAQAEPAETDDEMPW